MPRALPFKPGWLAYASLLTVSVLGGEVSRWSAPDAVAVASWVLSAALLVGLWCYALQKPFGSERYWRAVFWLLVVSNALMLLPVLMRGGAVALFTAALTLSIVPAYVAVYFYAYRSTAMWARARSTG
jgi:hypothetical protein